MQLATRLENGCRRMGVLRGPGRVIGRLIFPSFHRWIWLFQPIVVETRIGCAWPLRPGPRYDLGRSVSTARRVVGSRPAPPASRWATIARHMRGSETLAMCPTIYEWLLLSGGAPDLRKFSKPSSCATATSVIPVAPAAAQRAWSARHRDLTQATEGWRLCDSREIADTPFRSVSDLNFSNLKIQRQI
jgi:hypothetical protein